MEIENIISIINQIGFPIAVCIALFWLQRETVKHYEKLFMEFKGSIDNNSELIRKLIKGETNV